VSFLTRAAALDHIDDGIRINAVSPGTSDGPMSSLPGESREERDARIAPSIPLGRVGKLEEVAATVLWLASPESGFAVGHDLSHEPTDEVGTHPPESDHADLHGSVGCH
jgi:NAD(P)-dependent dehydrogenase (short-subunit alcohol dehydrogenase family)